MATDAPTSEAEIAVQVEQHETNSRSSEPIPSHGDEPPGATSSGPPAASSSTDGREASANQPVLTTTSHSTAGGTTAGEITVEPRTRGNRAAQPAAAAAHGVLFKEKTPDSPDGRSFASLDEVEDSGKSRLGRKRNSEWVFKPLRLKFKVTELEQLYKSYIYRQQQSLLFEACMLMVLLSVLVLLVFLGNEKFDVVPISESSIEECADLANLSFSFGRTGGIRIARFGSLPQVLIFIIFGVVFTMLGIVVFADKIHKLRLKIYSFITVGLLILLLYTLFSINIHRRASDQIDLTILILFFIYFMVPLALRVKTVISLSLSVVHLVVSTATADDTPDEVLGRQFVAHLLLLVSVNMMGVFYNYLADLAQRKAFSEIRRYIRSLIAINEQTRKKEHLLHSVIPPSMAEDVVGRIRAGGKNDTKESQFHDLHIKPADNVRYTLL